MNNTLKRQVTGVFDILAIYGHHWQCDNAASYIHQTPTQIDLAICDKIANGNSKKHLIGALGSRIRRGSAVTLPLDICQHIYDIYSKSSPAAYPTSPLLCGIDIYHINNEYKMIKGNTLIPAEYTIFASSEYKRMLLCQLSATDKIKLIYIIDHCDSYKRSVFIDGVFGVVIKYNFSNTALSISCPNIGTTAMIELGGNSFNVDSAAMLLADVAQIGRIAKNNQCFIDIKCTDLYCAYVALYINNIANFEFSVTRPNGANGANGTNNHIAFIYSSSVDQRHKLIKVIEAAIANILEPLILSR